MAPPLLIKTSNPQFWFLTADSFQSPSLSFPFHPTSGKADKNARGHLPLAPAGSSSHPNPCQQAGAFPTAPPPNHQKIPSHSQIFLGTWPALPRKTYYGSNNLFNTLLVCVWCHRSWHLNQTWGGASTHLYAVTFFFISKACAALTWLEFLLIPSLGPSPPCRGVPSASRPSPNCAVLEVRFLRSQACPLFFPSGHSSHTPQGLSPLAFCPTSTFSPHHLY